MLPGRMKQLSRREFGRIGGTFASLFAGGCGLDFDFLELFDEHSISYELQRGDPHNTPVVLNHEFLGTRESMRPYADFFAERGHTTLLWDYPWHGSSGNPTYPAYTNDTIVRDLYELLNTTGISHPVVMGWALGGFISLKYALQHPDNYSALIIVAGAHRGTSTVETMWRSLVQQRIRAFGFEFNLPAALGIMADFLRSDLPVENLDKPALVIAGESDEFVSKEVTAELIEKLNEREPGCRHEIWAGSPHGIGGTEPERVADVVASNWSFLFGA